MLATNLRQPKPEELPKDSVSEIVWDTYNGGASFLTSSWDGMLRYYAIDGNMDVHNIWMNSVGSPITACEIAPGNVAIAGMASGGIMACELGSTNMIPIGFHEAPICRVFYCRERSFLISLGYDKLIRFWDLNQALTCQMQIQLPHKTFTACYDYPYLAIGSMGGLLATINVAAITATTTITPDTFKNYGIDKASKFLSSSVNAAAKRVLIGTADGKAQQFNIKEAESGFIL